MVMQNMYKLRRGGGKEEEEKEEEEKEVYRRAANQDSLHRHGHRQAQ
jgi:hypothetical protein